MERIYHKGKEIEVTEPEYNAIIGTIFVEGMWSGIKGEALTLKEIQKITDNIIEKVLKERRMIEKSI